MKPEDLIEIKTKACTGPYVKRDAETFWAMKMLDVTLAGFNPKLHMHVYRIDMLEREIIPLRRIESINGVSLSRAQSSGLLVDLKVISIQLI